LSASNPTNYLFVSIFIKYMFAAGLVLHNGNHFIGQVDAEGLQDRLR